MRHPLSLTVTLGLALIPRLALAQVVAPRVGAGASAVPGFAVLPLGAQAGVGLVGPVLPVSLTPGLPSFQSSLTPLKTPALTPVLPARTAGLAPAVLGPSLPIAARGVAPDLGRSPSAAVTALPEGKRAVLRGALQGSVAAIEKGSKGSAESRLPALRALFEGGKASFADAPGFDQRPPDWSEDRRINQALRRLDQSPVGASVYRWVYQQYGSRLSIRVDDAPGATYDARLSWEGSRPVLLLTEALVDRQSSEMIAAYVAREFSDLYFGQFPASAERAYMAYGVMARTFAELTDGDRAYPGQWDYSRDQDQGGTYVMHRYYFSWKEAAKSFGGDPRSSPFFEFLRTRDDSNADRRSRLTLREQYEQGLIDRGTYRQMDQYFRQVAGSEQDWLRQTGRR